MSGDKATGRRRTGDKVLSTGRDVLSTSRDVIPVEWMVKKGDSGSAEPNSSRENLGTRPEPTTEDGSSNEEEMAPTPRAKRISTASRKSLHTHECRKYRDKISTKFKDLLEVIPESENYKLKHKADILDYAVNVIKDMSDHIRELKRELIVSNDTRAREWAQTTAQMARDGKIASAVEEFCTVVRGEPGWRDTRAWQIGSNNSDLTSMGDVPCGARPSSATWQAAKSSQPHKIDNVFACPLIIEGEMIVVVELIGNGDVSVPTKLANCLANVFKTLSSVFEPASESDAKRLRSEEDNPNEKSAISFLLNN
eukprot:Plantae.Rhodophyta-Purpureofilum_apyrenoidigerum.ctg16122.p1 GENE.Plantae.Rhodophyta-Purpureofilum_apyrenoidigerum.ctg16122~~Plantae.Rhodophyta-Purpureofilum_apyrenoidigerum.ctg16122.p1  ORF type:complete len:310 (-),score=53.98 Plantae.Rhodophyta-Purpureofilum_apyrenoidigerum.ctg16122:158-1087(-)